MTDPINAPIEDNELLARNIYHSSQYSHGRLREDCLYPNYKRESRELPGMHRCHISIQRVCFGGWDGIVQSALNTKGERQTLMGFMVGRASLVRELGFKLEAAAHERNPYHAHIYIPELAIPFSADGKEVRSIFDTKVRRRLEMLTMRLKFYSFETPMQDFCKECLFSGVSDDQSNGRV